MLIEVKARIAYIIDGKTKRKNVVFITDKEIFAEAEYEVMQLLHIQNEGGTVGDYEIQSLKIASVKEIIATYQGDHSYVATLKDIFTDDQGNEKPIKYKVLLWANNISEAMHNTREIARQGYDMQIEGLKEVDYEYLTDDEETTAIPEN